MTTAEIITRAIADHYVREPADLPPETVLADLGGDSLDVVEVCMSIEGRLNVDLGGYTQCKTIGDIIALAETVLNP